MVTLLFPYKPVSSYSMLVSDKNGAFSYSIRHCAGAGDFLVRTRNRIYNKKRLTAEYSGDSR
jgi:hypothetical protein